MSLASCREIRQALGVYVLGAIDPAERAQVDEHLASCPGCREELASLAGLPAMLRKVPLVEAERLAVAGAGAEALGAPPEDMLTSLVARTASVRRIHRWRGLAAAAAVVIVALGGGAAVATALQPGSHPSPSLVQHYDRAVGGSAGGIDLTVMYRTVVSGTYIRANVTGALQHGAVCQLQIVDGQGKVMVLGGWKFWNPSDWYPASTSVSGTNIRAFELTVGGKVVATART